MKDTSDEIENKFRNMLLAYSGEERLKMGCSMHAAARALVIASIPKKDAAIVNRALFLRFYGNEFDPKRRKRILRALREATDSDGKSDTSGSHALRVDKGKYRRKGQRRAKRSR